MDLYNCETRRELELREIDLQSLTDIELMELGVDLKIEFGKGVLKDEHLVIDALVQIIITQARRKAGLE